MLTGKDQLKMAFIVVAVIVIGVTMIGAINEIADCKAKGGQRLRGTWVWEGFKCYDAKSLKVLP